MTSIFYFLFERQDLEQDEQKLQLINNVTLVLSPHLVMIWIKVYVGIRSWANDFSRKTVESYFMHTFIYHIYSLISNTLMFTLQPVVYSGYIVSNLMITALIGFMVTYTLYKFLLFKDKDMRLHQQLWCGNIMDSSDAEQEKEKQWNMNKRVECKDPNKACFKKSIDPYGNEIFGCAQESYGCVIYVQKPTRKDAKKDRRNSRDSFTFQQNIMNRLRQGSTFRSGKGSSMGDSKIS